MLRKILITTLMVSWLLPQRVFALEEDARAKLNQASDSIYFVMEALLEEYVGRELTVQQLYEAAMEGMSGLLDIHSEYLAAGDMANLTGMLSGNTELVGVVLKESAGQIVVEDVLPGSSAEAAGVLKGDVVLAINGAQVAGLTVDAAVALISQAPSPDVAVDVERAGAPLHFDLKKTPLKIPSVQAADVAQMVTGGAEGVGYLYVSVIGDETTKDLTAAIRKMQGEGVTKLILDLRGNPGGYLTAAEDICGLLVPSGPIVHTEDKNGNRQTYYSEAKAAPFGKIAVLIDGDTASAAEIIASALQDSKAAVVVGRQSYGKGVVQSLYELQNNDGFKFTTMEYFRRNGGRINGIGVIPDVAVPVVESLPESAADNLEEAQWVGGLYDMLASLGYDAGRRGDGYSPKLQEALRAFQADRGLPAAGLTVETIRALNHAYDAFYSANDPDVWAALTALR